MTFVGIKRQLFYLPFILFYLFISPRNSNAQNITKIIMINSGGNIAFNINSLTEYNNGKSFNNWTRFNITFQDTSDIGGDGTSTGWRVLVRANTSTIQSDGASPDLPLSTLFIRPTTTIPGTTTFNITLTDADQTIVTGGDPGVLPVSGEIVISYDFGTTSPLLGKDPDYYFVDLIFTLVEIP